MARNISISESQESELVNIHNATVYLFYFVLYSQEIFTLFLSLEKCIHELKTQLHK